MIQYHMHSNNYLEVCRAYRCGGPPGQPTPRARRRQLRGCLRPVGPGLLALTRAPPPAPRPPRQVAVRERGHHRARGQVDPGAAAAAGAGARTSSWQPRHGAPHCARSPPFPLPLCASSLTYLTTIPSANPPPSPQTRRSSRRSAGLQCSRRRTPPRRAAAATSRRSPRRRRATSASPTRCRCTSSCWRPFPRRVRRRGRRGRRPAGLCWVPRCRERGPAPRQPARPTLHSRPRRAAPAPPPPSPPRAEIVRWPLFEATYGAEMAGQPDVFGDKAEGGAKRRADLQLRVVEHNVLTVRPGCGRGRGGRGRIGRGVWARGAAHTPLAVPIAPTRAPSPPAHSLHS
jgi:hypothetical protein